MSEKDKPDIQLLANVVITSQGKVALTKYDAEDERWWLPGAELTPYEHPDEAIARALIEISRALSDLKRPEKHTARLHHVESFRGRRGWHVMFNYLLQLESTTELHKDFQWFDVSKLPAMMHGAWEKSVIEKALK